ncbi:hypothetical protein GCM10017673_10770 [Streptosporangium violaceochromogenes]|nr:hypothetical protein GCM10017673_10770 [Streptosporangium violaceochromogenes]
MNRTTRSLLGVAAATAVLAIGVPALTSSASATTATASAAAAFDESWGPYYSKYYNGSRAKARGEVSTDNSDRVHVEGRLYDKYSPPWLCGYAQVKFENEDGDEYYYSAKKCGSNGYRPFHFVRHDVDSVQVRVCYWDNGHGKRKLCGPWDYVYQADSGEHDEEE